MRIFQRKSNWDRIRETAQAAAADGGARHAGKLALTAAGGAAVVTLASAAMSAVRRGTRS